MALDPLSVPGDSILCIYTDSKGGFWYSTADGELIWEMGNERREFQPGDGLPKGGIRSVREDQSGKLLAASFQGVSRFEDGKFTLLKTIRGPWNVVPGDLWFPGGDSIFRWDGNNLYSLLLPKSPLEAAFYERYPGGYNPYDNYDVCKDSRGRIWIGTSNLGVCRFDGENFRWISGNGLDESAVRIVMEDRDGQMWFGNSGEGFYRYESGKLINYRSLKGIGNAPGAAPNRRISYMAAAQDSAGDLWIATYEAGIWRYDGEEAQHYEVTLDGRQITFYTLTIDRNGTLWLGSHEAGVLRWDGEGFERVSF